jgi:hypothetical protein
MDNVVKEKTTFGEKQKEKDGKQWQNTNQSKEVIITDCRNIILIID